MEDLSQTIHAIGIYAYIDPFSTIYPNVGKEARPMDDLGMKAFVNRVSKLLGVNLPI